MTPADPPAAHAAVAPVDVLIEERRTLYRLAAELLGTPPSAVLDDDVMDSPVVRGRIGRAMATGGRVESSTLVSIGAVSRDAAVAVESVSVPVASALDANDLLHDALDWFRAELAVQSSAAPLRILTTADGNRFDAAMRLVSEGMALAMSVSPTLAADLFPHIALVGIVDPDSGGGLESASSRAFPGIVLLRMPGSALEATEGLVHEAAHQKLFDLAITRDLLTHESDRCEPFEPSWPPAGRRWSMEQALAAGHAYACLARFAADAAGLLLSTAGPSSLLPVAAERASLIGDWLLDHGAFLGSDAHTLLAGLYGLRPSAPPALSARIQSASIEAKVIRRRTSGGRWLVATLTRPPNLYFVDSV